MSEKEPRILTDREARAIVRDEFLPLLAPDSSKNPRFAVFGGAQGSRKTTLKPVVARSLGMQGALLLEGDDLFAFHPRYEQLVSELGDTFQAGKKVSSDIEFMYTETLAGVRERHADVMVVGPYTGLDFTLSRIAEFKESGYQVELAYTALHPALSQLGVMHRHMQTVEAGAGAGMLVSLELQEKVIKDTPVVMAEIERRGVADALHVVGPEGVVFSKRRQEAGTWVPARSIAEVVEETRARPWDRDVRADFARRRAAVEHGQGDDWIARLRSVDRLAGPMLRETTEAEVQASRDLMSLAFPGAAKEATRDPVGGPQSSGPEPESERGEGIDSGR
ncbi:zeta toxin family protein (plasmid) [Streptomyces europaeiscabiei]|uniref:zeta toxin family protein n=1 Tax=Streptomyces europaeiscabiei TaxID=146819 RepID=UPI002E7FB7C3|nr:zeta toxin family protein [Streptomyces europaeiscabiei]WUD38828.1 zeta toxin family protein [Streptomyces europaeiscabiei]